MTNKILFFLLCVVSALAYSDVTRDDYDVTFINGNFIAGGHDDILKTPLINISQDGIHWQAANIDTSGSRPGLSNIISIACNKTRCIASVDNGEGILYSTDNGFNWKFMKLSVDTTFLKVIYSNDKFLISSGDTIYYSYDGINWSQANMPTDLPYTILFLPNIAYNNNMYVAVGITVMDINPLASLFIVSKDGINWSYIDPKKIPFDIRATTGVIIANNTFYFSSEYYAGLLSTPNFMNFSIDNPTYQFQYIEYHNNLMFSKINNSQSASLSNDLGKTWYPTDGTPANFTSFGNSYAYGNGVYVYANSYDSKYSYDAIHWNSSTNKKK